MHRRAFFGFLAGGAVAAAAPLAFPDVEQTYKTALAHPKGTTAWLSNAFYWKDEGLPNGFSKAVWDGKAWRRIDQSAASSP